MLTSKHLSIIHVYEVVIAEVSCTEAFHTVITSLVSARYRDPMWCCPEAR